MIFTTAESLYRVHAERWRRRIKERYTPPRGISLTIFLPCSAKKPYSKSKSHKLFIKAIKRGAKEKITLVHEVIVTSPLAIVPRELENLYTAKMYDTVVTGHWSDDEFKILSEIVLDYIKKAKTTAYAHVDGALKDFFEEIGIKTTKNDIKSEEGTKELENFIIESLKDKRAILNKKERKIEEIRKIFDFQFGYGVGERIICGNVEIKGRQILIDDQLLATINDRGYLSISKICAELLYKEGINVVELNRVPNIRNINAKYVSSADYKIRIRDEVVLTYKGDIIGIGNARMCGEEMTRAEEGIAVVVRKFFK